MSETSLIGRYGTLRFHKGYYADGELAVFVLQENGEPYGKLSVFLEGRSETLKSNEFYAKTWGENVRLIEIARSSGLFEITGEAVEVGPWGCIAVLWRLK